jgi:hypothetical protein
VNSDPPRDAVVDGACALPSREAGSGLTDQPAPAPPGRVVVGESGGIWSRGGWGGVIGRWVARTSS